MWPIPAYHDLSRRDGACSYCASSLLSLAARLQGGESIGLGPGRTAPATQSRERRAMQHASCTLAMHGTRAAPRWRARDIGRREGERAAQERREARMGGRVWSGPTCVCVCCVYLSVCVCFDVPRQRRLSASRSRPPLFPPSAYHVRSFNVPFPTRLRPGAAKRWTNEITRKCA